VQFSPHGLIIEHDDEQRQFVQHRRLELGQVIITDMSPSTSTAGFPPDATTEPIAQVRPCRMLLKNWFAMTRSRGASGSRGLRQCSHAAQ